MPRPRSTTWRTWPSYPRKANRKISDRQPVAYFPELSEEELAGHFVPLDEDLRVPSAYPAFLLRRRDLLAEAMTALLDKYRPSWVDPVVPAPPAPTDGVEVSLTLYESGWDTGRLIVNATGEGFAWRGVVSVSDLEAAIDSAGQGGIDADVDVAGEAVTVRLTEEAIEIPLGPVLVAGTHAEWRHALDREREGAQPLSQCPTVEASPWLGDRLRFPVTSTD